MVSFKDFKRTFIPREISSATESVEDFVRPVTDPIRQGIAKAVPKELKPYASTILTAMLPIPGGPLAGFVGGFGVDAFLQKAMTDPDDEDTDIDYLKALMSGGMKSIANIDSSGIRNVADTDAAGNIDTIKSKVTEKGVTTNKTNYAAKSNLSDKGIFGSDLSRANDLATRLNAMSPADAVTAMSTDASIGNYLKTDFLSGLQNYTGASSGVNAGLPSNFGDYLANPTNPFANYSTAFDGVTTLMDAAKAVGTVGTGVQVTNTPSQVRDARQALLDAENRYERYIAEQKAKYGADFEEDRQTRIAAYKQYMGLAGYSEDEIDDALRVAGYIGDEETAYAANGGRIGFANGSDSYMGDVYGDRDRDSLNMKEFYKENPEAQVGTYINENRYKSEKIEKLETKLNEIIDMRQRTADRSRNPENDGMPSLMEKLLDKEIKALYADRTNDDLRKTRMQKLEEQQAARQQEAAMRAEQMKAAYQAEFGDGLNRTGRAMGGMMRPNYNMGGMMNASMMNNNMMNPRMGYAMGSQDRPNFNYGSGRQTPQGDPIAPNVPPGMQMDLRPGGFIELGTEPRADDVPAMVGKDEFVLNDRAVAGIGKLITGQPDARAGAKALYDLQNKMEATV